MKASELQPQLRIGNFCGKMNGITQAINGTLVTY